MERKIRVGITHGDINGIGYEVALKALAIPELTEICTPVFFGSGKVAGFYRKMLGLDDVPFNVVSDASEAKTGAVNLVNVTAQELRVEPGKATEESGRAALLALDTAVDAMLAGDIDVLVTAPINKAAMKLVGFPYPGHTEYLQDKLGGEGDSATMTFVDGDLRVSLLTVHLPLSQVPGAVTAEALTGKLRQMESMLKRDFGRERPLIAVLALNPHAGDGGVIGTEEDEIMRPAIAAAADSGLMASGPYPADGFFCSGAWKKFDGVLAIYHDQGLVAFKTLSGPRGVNYTAGLPYVRTSPDHGTGYDIAGKGKADPESLLHAIYAAIDIFRARARHDAACADPLRHVAPEKGDRRKKGRDNKEQRQTETPRQQDKADDTLKESGVSKDSPVSVPEE